MSALAVLYRQQQLLGTGCVWDSGSQQHEGAQPGLLNKDSRCAGVNSCIIITTVVCVYVQQLLTPQCLQLIGIMYFSYWCAQLIFFCAIQPAWLLALLVGVTM